jgi:PIN domain nuclease of toxin-antitoxin system
VLLRCQARVRAKARRTRLSPFDRMVVAVARAVVQPLVTADTRIQESGLIEVIWD